MPHETHVFNLNTLVLTGEIQEMFSSLPFHRLKFAVASSFLEPLSLVQAL